MLEGATEDITKFPVVNIEYTQEALPSTNRKAGLHEKTNLGSQDAPCVLKVTS